MVRTRFAPSPTGYLHIGGARTALFSWAFARRHGGRFVLRVEDTDVDRSTQESVKAILDGMQWLGLDYDEGPYYQMQRLERYREVIEQLLKQGDAYYCYASKEELNELREQQKARGLKPRYDGRWRDSTQKPPPGVTPVVRFKNPLHGEVAFEDLVKGRIVVRNEELDDLVIMRADGTPTYNFGVVVDDLDMNISHVIRGDDHVNNTPRQINILKALNATLPQYAHVPMILGSDGERLSKRHGAVSVMQYYEEGYLPEALLNYLARLGWSHGDEEIFDREQFVNWFDLKHISKSPAKFNPEKLAWVNQQYLKKADDNRLADLATPFLIARGCVIDNRSKLDQAIMLVKERVNTIEELADAVHYFYIEPNHDNPHIAEHLTSEVKPLIAEIAKRFADIDWNREAIHEVLKEVATLAGFKLGKVAMPLRVVVTGQTQTPSIDAVLELIGKEAVLSRIKRALAEPVESA